METQVTQTTDIQLRINEDLKKYHLPDEIIANLQKRCSGLSIKDISDKDGFEIVVEARKEVKNLRIAVEKTREKLKEDALKYGRAIDAEAKRLTNLLAPIENSLLEKERAYLMEKQRLKEEEERKEQEKLNYRYSSLNKLDMVFDGEIYVYEQFSISLTQIKIMTEKEFEEFVDMVKIVRDRILEEQKRIEEEKAAKLKLYEERKEKLIPYWLFLKEGQNNIDWGEIPEESFCIIYSEVVAAKEKFEKDKEAREEENQRQAAIIRKQHEEIMTMRKKAVLELGFEEKGEHLIYRGRVLSVCAINESDYLERYKESKQLIDQDIEEAEKRKAVVKEKKIAKKETSTAEQTQRRDDLLFINDQITSIQSTLLTTVERIKTKELKDKVGNFADEVLSMIKELHKTL